MATIKESDRDRRENMQILMINLDQVQKKVRKKEKKYL